MIESLSFTPGNKTAGFTLYLTEDAVKKLNTIGFSDELYEQLINKTQLTCSQIIPKKVYKSFNFKVSSVNHSLLVRSFSVIPEFAVDVSVNGEDLDRVLNSSTQTTFKDYLGYYSHNVDTPYQSLALLSII